VIVDSATYMDGRRSAPRSLEGAHNARHDRSGFAWTGLFEPAEEDFVSVTSEFELHQLAVEDAVKAHQRPKIEPYSDAIFVVLESARYLEESKTVEFAELHVVLGADFLVTVRHGAACEREPEQRDQEASAWAAILVVPTIITGFYGMNCERMPELTWTTGHPLAPALMAVLSVLLYGGFKRSGWLLIVASRGVGRGTPPRCGCERILGRYLQPRALVARVRRESL